MGISTCSPSDKLDASDLAGYWQLNFALVNGKNTDRLRDLFLDFDADQKVRTNIFGETFSFDYEYTEDEIIQLSDPQLNYSIQEFSDSLLVLKTNIRKADFLLHFYKVRSTTNVDYLNSGTQ
jgi:hypothetical protein